MKTIFVLLVLTFIVNTREAHALFGHVEAEKARREHAEQQLDQSQWHLDQTQQQLGEQQQLAKEQQRIAVGLQRTIGEQQRAASEQNKLTSKWQTTALVLGIVAGFTLIAGTAIGSRGRHHATTEK